MGIFKRIKGIIIANKFGEDEETKSLFYRKSLIEDTLIDLKYQQVPEEDPEYQDLQKELEAIKEKIYLRYKKNNPGIVIESDMSATDRFWDLVILIGNIVLLILVLIGCLFVILRVRNVLVSFFILLFMAYLVVKVGDRWNQLKLNRSKNES